MRRALVLASTVAVGALSACVPPPTAIGQPANCAVHPVTKHIFGTREANCNHGLPYIAVNERCGPLVKQDYCAKFYNQIAGPNGLPVGYVIALPSSVRPTEGDSPWTQVR